MGWYDDPNDEPPVKCPRCWGEGIDEETGEKCYLCDGGGEVWLSDAKKYHEEYRDHGPRDPD